VTPEPDEWALSDAEWAPGPDSGVGGGWRSRWRHRHDERRAARARGDTRRGHENACDVVQRKAAVGDGGLVGVAVDAPPDGVGRGGRGLRWKRGRHTGCRGRIGRIGRRGGARIDGAQWPCGVYQGRLWTASGGNRRLAGQLEDIRLIGADRVYRLVRGAARAYHGGVRVAAPRRSAARSAGRGAAVRQRGSPGRRGPGSVQVAFSWGSGWWSGQAAAESSSRRSRHVRRSSWRPRTGRTPSFDIQKPCP
jgi:hypothetical protein